MHDCVLHGHILSLHVLPPSWLNTKRIHVKDDATTWNEIWVESTVTKENHNIKEKSIINHNL